VEELSHSSVSEAGAMPTTLKIDTEAGIVYSTFYGEVDTPELIEQVAAIRRHPDFNPQFRELIDASNVTSFEVSSDEVRDLAIREAPFAPSARRVLVASEDLVFGLARMFQTFGGEHRPHFEVVRTLEEAYRLLGIRPELTSR
jgi:hypothetical protein